MSNYRIGSGDKFFSRGVPLHAVDFSCNPFNVTRIAAKFGKFGNWQNMIQRVVQAKNDLFACIGTTVVLIFQLLANYLGVFCSFETIRGSLLEIARFAKRIATIFHSQEAYILATAGTHSTVSHLLLPSGGAPSQPFRAGVAINLIRDGWSHTQRTQSSSLKVVVPSQVLLSTRGGISIGVFDFIALGGFSVLLSYLCRRFELAYTLLSQGVNLRFRFANWLGSYGVISAVRAACILPQRLDLLYARVDRTLN